MAEETLSYPDMIQSPSDGDNVLRNASLIDATAIIASAVKDTHNSLNYSEYLATADKQINTLYDRKLDINHIYEVIDKASERLNTIYIDGHGFISNLLKSEAKTHFDKDKDLYYNINGFVEDVWNIMKYVDVNYVILLKKLLENSTMNTITVELLRPIFVITLVLNKFCEIAINEENELKILYSKKIPNQYDVSEYINNHITPYTLKTLDEITNAIDEVYNTYFASNIKDHRYELISDNIKNITTYVLTKLNINCNPVSIISVIDVVKKFYDFHCFEVYLPKIQSGMKYYDNTIAPTIIGSNVKLQLIISIIIGATGIIDKDDDPYTKNHSFIQKTLLHSSVRTGNIWDDNYCHHMLNFILKYIIEKSNNPKYSSSEYINRIIGIILYEYYANSTKATIDPHAVISSSALLSMDFNYHRLASLIIGSSFNIYDKQELIIANTLTFPYDWVDPIRGTIDVVMKGIGIGFFESNSISYLVSIFRKDNNFSLMSAKVFTPYICAMHALARAYYNIKYTKNEVFYKDKIEEDREVAKLMKKDLYKKQAREILRINKDGLSSSDLAFNKEQYLRIVNIFTTSLFKAIKDPTKRYEIIDRVFGKLTTFDFINEYKLLRFTTEIIVDIIAADLELGDLIDNFKRRFNDKNIEWDSMLENLAILQGLSIISKKNIDDVIIALQDAVADKERSINSLRYQSIYAKQSI